MGNSPSKSNSNSTIPNKNSTSSSTQQATPASDDLNSNEPTEPDDSRLSYPTTSTTRSKSNDNNNDAENRDSTTVGNTVSARSPAKNIDIVFPKNKHDKKAYAVGTPYRTGETSDFTQYMSVDDNTPLNTSAKSDFGLDIDVSLAKAFATSISLKGSSSTTTTTTTLLGSSSSSSDSRSSSGCSVGDSGSSSASSYNEWPMSINESEGSNTDATFFAENTKSATTSTITPKNDSRIHQSSSRGKQITKHVNPSSRPSSLPSSSLSSIPNYRTSSSRVFLKRYAHDRSSTEGLDIDDAIEKLLKIGETRYYKPRDFPFHSWEIQLICYHAREIFLNQPSLLKLQAPIKVVGDVHGQFTDLLRILKLSGVPPETNYLFLGDYVDRGKQSLETALLLLCYKIKYKDNFFMLRGNHESANVTKMYGFYDECKRRKGTKIWKMFIDVFNTLPFAAVIQDRIFCIHGGISPDLTSMSQIENIKRPTDIPDEGLITDLLWSDPDPNTTSWSLNDRGVSYTFGKRTITDFCSQFKFDLIIRGHMVVEDGYEFFAKKKFVTVFSAPNYCGEFQNWGAVMSVTTGLMCSFELLKPHVLKPKKHRH